MYKYLAHTIKGFKDVSEREITSTIPDARILEKEIKVILFESPKTPNTIPILQSIDDLGFFVSNNQDVLVSKSEIHKLLNIRDIISGYRKLDDSFSITISLYKTDIDDKDALQNDFAKILSEGLHMKYTPRQHENFDIRFDVTDEQTVISIRTFSKPLFHRGYRVRSQLGALRPSIAGAMLQATVGNQKGLQIVDNLCGSGTILCESALAGHIPSGGDISEYSVETIMKNLGSIRANLAGNIKRIDATGSPWKDNQFDVAISNLPWDDQISVKSIMQLYKKVILEYKRIVKPGGRIGLLSKKPDIVRKYMRESCGKSKLEEFQLGFLGQKPTFIVSQRNL